MTESDKTQGHTLKIHKTTPLYDENKGDQMLAILIHWEADKFLKEISTDTDLIQCAQSAESQNPQPAWLH